MNNIPPKLKKELAVDLEYKTCSLTGHDPCDGRITWEHALYFRGRQVQKRFAIIPLCELHHGIGKYLDAGTLLKDLNIWVALNRATDEELKEISKATDYTRMRERLNEKYGVYSPVHKPVDIAV